MLYIDMSRLYKEGFLRHYHNLHVNWNNLVVTSMQISTFKLVKSSKTNTKFQGKNYNIQEIGSMIYIDGSVDGSVD